MMPLPIDDILPLFLKTAAQTSNLILQAPPGAGKTTRIPIALLDIIPPSSGVILMVEPRRLAAVSAARWMAKKLGEDAGKTVGYSIRFESRVSAMTRIEVITEGILTRRLQNDPLLEGTAMVIFDEFHERSLNMDLGLALCLYAQRQARNDLKILVMSATLDCEPLSVLMDNAPVINAAGRIHPVREIYLEDSGKTRLEQRVVAAIRRALRETEGDVLVFLPGSGEIRFTASLFESDDLEKQGISVCQLYGDLPFEKQQTAILPSGRRKVVLATSIAETSLTIDGVRVVIDSGFSRRMRHDPASGLNRLVTLRESRASAIQRAGRAGRTADGVCYRLFSRHTFNAMVSQSPPEILETDLSPLVLELAAWGVRDPLELSWIDPPPEAAVDSARRFLSDAGALDSAGRVTPAGREMVRFPLHPRLSRMLTRSRELNCLKLGCALAALLSERDVIRRGEPGDSFAQADLSDRLEALRRFANGNEIAPGADHGALVNAWRVCRQFYRLVGITKADDCVAWDHGVAARLLLTVYPDRVAMRREGENERYLLSNGRGARFLAPGVPSAPLFLAVLSVGGSERREGTIRLWQEIKLEQIREELGSRIERCENVFWDIRERRVVAVTQERLGRLTLSLSPFTPKPESLLPVLLEAVRSSGLELLNRSERFFQLQFRITLLRREFPDDGWPDYSDAALLNTLEEWLAPALCGIRSSRRLTELDTSALLLNRLDYRFRRDIDDLAPAYLTVPSGSRVKLDYCQGDAPVLAVKLQEMFGLEQTPIIARGKVAVLLHLLSPAGRLLQVTSDLKGFWENSYHQVKREMKGRYPKHPWPDNPLHSLPTRRTKRRS